MQIRKDGEEDDAVGDVDRRWRCRSKKVVVGKLQHWWQMEAGGDGDRRWSHGSLVVVEWWAGGRKKIEVVL
ncbi:hypothetical protein L6452_31941 [Arctium lappa]|uniref:Uncharacterized protein n=1 Tax=Arctium lappa TaxID=4217 RepID=A0ACB8Z2X2_ARCLA|nr:hypothetical protein L6452_31941 [Arctium lappa]